MLSLVLSLVLSLTYILYPWQKCGEDMKQQLSKPNDEIQLIAPSLYSRPGVYLLQGLHTPQPIIETGVYLNTAFNRGNMVDR